MKKYLFLTIAVLSCFSCADRSDTKMLAPQKLDSSITDTKALSEKIKLGALDMKMLEPKALDKASEKNLFNEVKATYSDFNPTDLASRSKFALYELANHEIVTNTYVVENTGKLEYLGAKLAAKGQKVLFQQDYTSFKFVDVNGVQKRIGIMLRLEAELITKKADLDLNGIFAIGVAASSGSAFGKLRVKVYGLSGAPIMQQIPTPTNISEEALLNAFTSIATIKSKIYEDDVFVLPQDIPNLPFEFGKY